MSILNFEAFKVNDIHVDENSNFALLDIDVCRSGDNLNHIFLTQDSVRKAVSTLYPNPVLYKCNRFGTDFLGHEEDEMIAGMFLNDTKVFEKADETWINGKAIIYKRYVPNVMEILKKKNGKTDVSMEIDVLASYQDENNQTVVTDFSFIGVTLLGVTPAIPEANATVLSFSSVQEVEEAYKAEHFSKYDKLNLSIPKRIKDNITLALDKYKAENLKASSNALGVARYLAREESITIDKIRKIDEYFKSYNKKVNKGNEFIYSLYGGDEGNKWVSALMEEIKEIDDYKHTTFGKEKKEMAESLKVNKSKDAMSESSWGDVDKSTLRKKVTEASNASSIVHDVYMVVEDGWEDAPSEKLKYPVMEVKNGELVYNRGGLASALGYAKAENDNAVVKKVEAIYKKLDLDEGDEKKMSKEFEIEGREAWGDIIKEVHSHLGNHYYVDSVEKNKIVVTDTKTKTRYDIDADVKAGKDDKNVSADIHWDTKKKSKVQKGFDRKEDEEDERKVDDETDTKQGKIKEKEDEDLDDDDDDDDDDDKEDLAKKDKKKAKMADDNVYTEPNALLELLNRQAEVNDKLAREYTEDEMFASLFAEDEREKCFEEHDMAKMQDDEREVYCHNMIHEMSRFEKADSEERLSKLTVADMTSLAKRMARMCKLAKDSTKVLLDENKSLKKFKKDAEEKAEMEARDKKADEVLSKAKEDLSKEEMEEFKEESKKFSFSRISVWENKVISKAYENSKKNKTHTESFSSGAKVYSPWANETNKVNTDSDNLW